MTTEIHFTDWGTRLNFTIKKPDGSTADLSTCTNLKLYLRRPDGLVKSFDMTLTSDGTDGKCYYVTVSGDIDLTGNWKMEVRATYPAAQYYSDVEKIKVLSILPA